jgi:hypothetical protein
MKTCIFVCQLLLACTPVLAQQGASFYPRHRGDVWQYRWVSTGQIARTRYLDSLRIDSVSRDTYLYFRPVGTGARERIDSLQNVFNLNFQPNHPRYKLAADSGTSWVAGYEIYGGDTLSTTMVTITRIYPGYVFGVPTTIKVFRFDRAIRGGGTFWLANDYLAEGFGVVQQDMEPSDIQYLSGAMINGVQYGTILHATEGESLPVRIRLFQNYPNPFNPVTIIVYQIPTNSHVKLEVFDVLGQLLKTLVNEPQVAGTYQVQFDASHLSSGVYFYRLTAGDVKITKRMLVVR